MKAAVPMLEKSVRHPRKKFSVRDEKSSIGDRESNIASVKTTKVFVKSNSASVKFKEPTLRPRRARSAARREAILAAALDEFSARGYEASRLDDVAKRAGVAKGTIYLYFHDKENLFQELVRSMLTPLVGSIEAIGATDAPFAALADRLVDLFVREIYETRRKDVIRLMIAEGRRFPELAEFYYRVVLSRILAAMRALLVRAAARGEVSAALVDFPQILAAPGLIAIVWNGLFERFEPLDIRAMMKTHIELLLAHDSEKAGPRG